MYPSTDSIDLIHYPSDLGMVPPLPLCKDREWSTMSMNRRDLTCVDCALILEILGDE